MWFIYGINQHTDRVLIQQIHVVFTASSTFAGIQDKQAVQPFLQIELYHSILIRGREILSIFSNKLRRFTVMTAIQPYRQNFFRLLQRMLD